jgi:integrase
MCRYLSDRAESHRPQTLERRLSAIRLAHETTGLSSPTLSADVRLVLAGIRRVKGLQSAPKTALELGDLRRLLNALEAVKPLRACRDRALLLLGFAAALRRSELAALDVADLEFTDEGLVLTVQRSKTDQEQVGRQIGVPYGRHPETCPVAAVRDWLERAEIAEGPVFRGISRHDQLLVPRLSDQGIARAVKAACRRAGLDESAYGAHSLRSGFATTAARAGVEERLIAEQTGHRSMQTLRRYIHRGSLFRNNAASRVGL